MKTLDVVPEMPITASPTLTRVTPAFCIPCDRNRTLIVDDEKLIVQAFSSVIACALPNLRVDTALNGKEAVNSFTAAHQGILIMDLHMPVMDGHASFDAIRALCRARNWEMPSVIFCTGFAPPAALNDILRDNPAHALLLKPVSVSAIVETIRSRIR